VIYSVLFYLLSERTEGECNGGFGERSESLHSGAGRKQSLPFDDVCMMTGGKFPPVIKNVVKLPSSPCVLCDLDVFTYSAPLSGFRLIQAIDFEFRSKFP
jgi:hypothetical protein